MTDNAIAGRAIDKAASSLDVLQQFRPHDYTLTDFFASRCEKNALREFLCYDDRAYSWTDVSEDIDRLAWYLQRSGVALGDRILVCARNSKWHLLALFAAARLGAIFVPVNPQFTSSELQYVTDHCRPKIILHGEDEVAVIGALMLRDSLSKSLGEVERELQAYAPANGDNRAAAATAQSTCIIVYTSGTTGFPKGAMHSQQSLVLAGEAFVERMALNSQDRLLAILPMFHINAIFYSVMGSIAAGATLLIEKKFSATTFWQRVKKLGATQVNVIEAIVAILLNRPGDEQVPDHGLKKIYGVRQAVVKPFRDKFGVPVLVGGYAMTEIPGVLSTPLDRDTKPGSMGVVCRHPDHSRAWASCRVVDDAGMDVADGELGELVVSTPVMMQGYFEDEEQTRASFRDGWFLTGDLVRRDTEGFYFFVSRKKDIIRRRGENVAGMEIDRIVVEHPQVLIAAAIGVPSAFGDEDILVAIKRKEHATINERDIVEWTRGKLSAAKIPRYVVFLDEMPLTATHKVAKAALRKDVSLLSRAVDVETPQKT